MKAGKVVKIITQHTMKSGTVQTFRALFSMVLDLLIPNLKSKKLVCKVQYSPYSRFKKNAQMKVFFLPRFGFSKSKTIGNDVRSVWTVPLFLFVSVLSIPVI